MHWTAETVAIGLLLAAVGCSSGPDRTVTDRVQPFQSAGADVTATLADNGGHIQLRVGQVFDIVLDNDYDTTRCQWHDKHGYEWAILTPLGQRYEPQQKPPDGADGGTYTSRYRATGPGTVHLTLSEEDNAYPPRVARRFAIDVTVESINS